MATVKTLEMNFVRLPHDRATFNEVQKWLYRETNEQSSSPILHHDEQ